MIQAEASASAGGCPARAREIRQLTPAMKIIPFLTVIGAALLAGCDQSQQLARSVQQQSKDIQEAGRATQDLMAKIAALQTQTGELSQALAQGRGDSAAALEKAASGLESRLAGVIEEKLAAALKDTNARLAALEAAVKKMEVAASAPPPAPKTDEVRPAIPSAEPKKDASSAPPPPAPARPIMTEKRSSPVRERIRLSFPSSPGSASGPSMPVQAVPDPKELRGEGASKGGEGGTRPQ